MSQDDVISALADWIRANGRQPTYNEWRSRRESPSHQTVVKACGSWARAVKAAGGIARTRGQYERPSAPAGPVKLCVRCGQPVGVYSFRFCGHRCATLTHYDRIGRASRYRVQRPDGRYRYRVVAEEHLRRELAAGEVVHHIDGDRQNDEPWNLAVFPSNREHMAFHWRGGSITAVDGTGWLCEAVGYTRLVVSLANPV